MPYRTHRIHLITLGLLVGLGGCGGEDVAESPQAAPADAGSPDDRAGPGMRGRPPGAAARGVVPGAVRAVAGEMPLPADDLPTVITVERDHTLVSLGLRPEGTPGRGAYALLGSPPSVASPAGPTLLPGGGDSRHLVAVGNVDDDPAREIISFHPTTVVQLEGRAYRMRVLGDAVTPTGLTLHGVAAVAAGDLDADGRDEIAVIEGTVLTVIDDALADFAVLHRAPVEFEVLGDDGEPELTRFDDALDLAIGDIDGDMGADIAVAGTLDGAPFIALLPCRLGDEGLAVGPALAQALTIDGQPVHIETDAVSVAIDDLDGDGRAEAVMAAADGTAGGPNHYDLHIGAWQVTSPTQLTPRGSATFREDSPGDGRAPSTRFHAARMTTARLSAGDEARPATVVVNEALLTFGGGVWSRAHWDWDPLFDCGVRGAKSADLVEGTQLSIAAGDFDDDGVDELAVAGVGMCAVGVFEATADGAGLDAQIPLTDTIGESESPLLAAVAFFPDIYEQALVESRRLFTEILPIAAVAAPPCHADPEVQGLDGCQARIGTSESMSEGVGGGASLSVELSAGVVVDGGLVPVKYSMKFSLTQTVAYSHTVTETLTRGGANDFEPGLDGVLGLAVPWDEYIYRVEASNVPEAIGTITTLRLPRPPIHVPMTVADYNATSAPDMQLDDALFAHVVGDPSSYAGGSPPAGFVQGTAEQVTAVASANPYIDFATEETDTVVSTTTLGLSFDAEVVGLAVGAELSVAGEASMTYGIGRSTTLGASIPPVLDPGDGYRVTLYAGPIELDRGLELLYGNYLVD